MSHSYNPSVTTCRGIGALVEHRFCQECFKCRDRSCDQFECKGSVSDQVNEALDWTLPDSVLDSQVGGDHYKKLGAYQPWEVCAAWLTSDELRGAAKLTAIAYLCREREKGGLEDIKKAVHTLQIYLELQGKEESK